MMEKLNPRAALKPLLLRSVTTLFPGPLHCRLRSTWPSSANASDSDGSISTGYAGQQDAPPGYAMSTNDEIEKQWEAAQDYAEQVLRKIPNASDGYKWGHKREAIIQYLFPQLAGKPEIRKFGVIGNLMILSENRQNPSDDYKEVYTMLWNEYEQKVKSFLTPFQVQVVESKFRVDAWVPT